jgi:hypothetical protein
VACFISSARWPRTLDANRLRHSLKYGAALFPGLVWLTAVLYKTASEGVAFVLILAAFVAAVTSFPVVVIAFVKLLRGRDTPWVVVSLVFSLPVLILSLIAIAATVTRAQSLASNSAAHPEPLKRCALWHPSSRRPGGRER